METKTLSDNSLKIIEQYQNFKIGNAVCSIPYFNNRTLGLRGALRVESGKGSIDDLKEEIEQKIFKEKLDIKSFDNDSLKRYLVDNNLGIDCSAFAYYILNEESKNKGKGEIEKNLSFPFCKGILGKIKCKIRPIENANVQTFAHEENSKTISIKEILVGDIITMLGVSDDYDRDHILIVYKIDYENSTPKNIYYTHTISWPTDGKYNHGIHDGKIEILNINENLIKQKWIENDKTDEENFTFVKAKKSKTELRRINWF